MRAIILAAILIGDLGACVATSSDGSATTDDPTSTTQQDVTGRTCSPRPDASGNYTECYVVEASGTYLVTGITAADCNTCGLAVSRDVCWQFNPFGTECDHLPGSGGGGGGGGPIIGTHPGCPDGCFDDASGICHC